MSLVRHGITIIVVARTPTDTQRVATTRGGRPRTRVSRYNISVCRFSAWANLVRRTRANALTTICRICLPRTSWRSSSCNSPGQFSYPGPVSLSIARCCAISHPDTIRLSRAFAVYHQSFCAESTVLRWIVIDPSKFSESAGFPIACARGLSLFIVSGILSYLF